MTIQPIIDFYGTQPVNPAIHDQVAIHMRRNVKHPEWSEDGRKDAGKASLKAAKDAATASITAKAAAERDKYRVMVWAMRDVRLPVAVIGRHIGKSGTFVRRILSEPRP